MKYIRTNELKEGMMLASDLYYQNYKLLMSEGVVLNENNIKRIKELGFSFVCVKEVIETREDVYRPLSPEVAASAIKSIKSTFDDFKQLDAQKISYIDENIKEIKMIIDAIIEDLLKNKNVVFNLMNLKEFNNYTYFHSRNVAVMSLLIGMGLNLKMEEFRELGLAAILHDIGKIFITKQILDKPGKLDDSEFEKIKKHSEYGYEHLKKTGMFSNEVCMGVLHHHERFDGTGYPSGIKGEEISTFGRIIAVADVYDALTSKRTYHEAELPSDACEFIMANSGLQFQPEIVDVFIKKIAPFPVGTKVMLSNGEIGNVIRNFTDASLRPLVKVLKSNNKYSFIDLAHNRQYYNVTILSIV